MPKLFMIANPDRPLDPKELEWRPYHPIVNIWGSIPPQQEYQYPVHATRVDVPFRMEIPDCKSLEGAEGEWLIITTTKMYMVMNDDTFRSIYYVHALFRGMQLPWKRMYGYGGKT